MSGVLLGWVDTRLNPLDRAWLSADGGRYRWRALWDQGDDTPVDGLWRRPDDAAGSGRLLDTLRCTPERHPPRRTAGEELDLGGRGAEGRRSRAHGGLVARLLGGAVDPFTGRSDAASGCDVAGVMLPTDQLRQAHGQWLPVAVLSALEFLLQQRRGDELLIVNLSVTGGVGLRGGGLLSAAIDELVEAEQGRLVVVMAVGNERRRGGHLQGEIEPGGSATFRVFLPAGRAQSTLLDWQATGGDGQALRWSAHAPQGGPSRRLAPGRGQRLLVPEAPPGTALAWLAQQGWPSPDRCQRGVWAVAPTDTDAGAALAGWWSFTLSNPGATRVTWDAWLARNDRPGLDRQASVRFDHAAVRADTVGALAAAQRVVRVGGYLPAGPGRAVLYPDSGSGGRVLPGPDVLGLAQLPAQLDPERGAGGRPRAARGTSVAAPFVARRLANAVLASGRAPADKAACLALLTQPGALTLLPGDDLPEERSVLCVPS